MTGPKTFPTAFVPRLCTRKSPSKMVIAIGITHLSNDADTSPSPSTALRTEIAGVMIPSP